MKARRPRIFIGLREVAGVYSSLQVGLESLGIATHRVDEGGNPRQYEAGRHDRGPMRTYLSGLPARIALGSARVSRRIGSARGLVKVAWLCAGVALGIIKSLYRGTLLLWVLLAHDVVVFTDGSSFFLGREFPLLRRLGKRIVVVFTGSDHRPAFLNGRSVRALSIDEVVKESDRIQRYVRLAERHANAIVALSSSAQFHRRPFVHLLAMGIPYAAGPADPSPNGSVFTGRGVRIVHSPTDPVSKGTPRVRAIVDRFRDEGLELDYVEIIGRPHADVLSALSECDFAIDELYSDTPLGRFATEAAWLGKPAVTSGEYARAIVADVPGSLIPPSIFVPPEDVEGAIRRLIVDADWRRGQGDAVQAFVRERWQPVVIAERFLRIAEGVTPREWTYDPARLRYVGGWGLDDADWKRYVGAVVDRVTVRALGILPALEELLQKRLKDPEQDNGRPPAVPAHDAEFRSLG